MKSLFINYNMWIYYNLSFSANNVGILNCFVYCTIHGNVYIYGRYKEQKYIKYREVWS